MKNPARPEIPEIFYKYLREYPYVTTVAELRTLLAELPDDLLIGPHSQTVVVVSNVEGRIPYVEFKEDF